MDQLKEAELEYRRATAPARDLEQQAKDARDYARTLEERALVIRREHWPALSAVVNAVYTPGKRAEASHWGRKGIYVVLSVEGTIVWLKDTTNPRRRIKRSYSEVTILED